MHNTRVCAQQGWVPSSPSQAGCAAPQDVLTACAGQCPLRPVSSSTPVSDVAGVAVSGAAGRGPAHLLALTACAPGQVKGVQGLVDELQLHTSTSNSIFCVTHRKVRASQVGFRGLQPQQGVTFVGAPCTLSFPGGTQRIRGHPGRHDWQAPSGCWNSHDGGGCMTSCCLTFHADSLSCTFSFSLPWVRRCRAMQGKAKHAGRGHKTQQLRPPPVKALPKTQSGQWVEGVHASSSVSPWCSVRAV